MTFTYCDARHDGTPVHRCLCYMPARHEWGDRRPTHRCICGHEWTEETRP